MGLILATPLTIAILLMNIKYLACSLIFVSVSAVYIYVGPINAVLNNSVDANSRSRAMSLNLLIVNSCGSSYSSAVVGAISDSTGKLDMALLVHGLGETIHSCQCDCNAAASCHLHLETAPTRVASPTMATSLCGCGIDAMRQTDTVTPVECHTSA
ncbi:hypothetical protein Pelo_13140 [Pelomyxa schiedti]|nr:hypothetical protein Pelo_13140 [Pelomyxa schiedti]